MKIGKSRDRIDEAHHTKSRKDGIRTLGWQIQELGICLDQSHLAEHLCPLPGYVEKQRGHIYPNHLPLGSDSLSELEKGLSCSAPDVENNISHPQIQGFDGLQPQRRKLTINQFIPLGPRLCVKECLRHDVLINLDPAH